MKTCKSCLKAFPDEAFPVCKIVAGKVYRNRKCQKCRREVVNRRRGGLRAWLDGYKKGLVCGRCGFDDYRALEFHHHARGGKEFNVADMIRSGLSVESIRREIEKCSVLCSNCHQIEHYAERKK